jgi:hypothetical protein
MTKKARAAKTPLSRARSAGNATAATGKFGALLERARAHGLLANKTARIGGRVNPALIEKAKRMSGVGTDSDLIELALANLAVEDDFPRAFAEARGKIDRDLDLDF